MRWNRYLGRCKRKVWIEHAGQHTHHILPEGSDARHWVGDGGRYRVQIADDVSTSHVQDLDLEPEAVTVPEVASVHQRSGPRLLRPPEDVRLSITRAVARCVRPARRQRTRRRYDLQQAGFR